MCWRFEPSRGHKNKAFLPIKHPSIKKPGCFDFKITCHANSSPFSVPYGVGMAKKNCNHCGLYKDKEEFNWRYKELGIRHNTCRECQHQHQDNWYQSHKQQHLDNVHERKRRLRDEAREYVYQYLLTHPCVDCGQDDPRALQFDHVISLFSLNQWDQGSSSGRSPD